MIVYHGSTIVIKHPDVDHSYHALDFGKGFYVTTVKQQAIRWAKRKAELMKSELAIVNAYQKNGIWDKARALEEIKAYPNYDQFAFISQDAVDKLLLFESFTEV